MKQRNKEGRQVIADFKSRIEAFIENKVPSSETGAICGHFINFKRAIASGDAEGYIESAYVELMAIINEKPIYDETEAREFIMRLRRGELDKTLFERLEEYSLWKEKYL